MSCIPHKTLSQSEIKITYLHEENKLLKERIQDLEEIIKLNKKANERTIALESHSKQEPLINKHSRSNAAEEQLKFFKSITDELTKENSSLNLKIEKLMKEVDLAKDKVRIHTIIFEKTFIINIIYKALMCDQVANEFKRQERETTNDYKTELLNLKKKLEEKEKKNKEMQVGGIFRIKNIISTDEKSILYHSELEGYKFIMAKTLKKISILKNEKEELIKLNQVN